MSIRPYSIRMTATALLGLGFAACAAQPGAPEARAQAAPTASEAPSVVLATFGEYAPAGVEAAEVTQEDENGLVTWSAEYPGPDGQVEITALADGTLVSVEREVPMAEVPAGVRTRAVGLLGAEAFSVDHLRLAVYELEDRDASGAVQERFVDPFGRVVLERTSPRGAGGETPVALEQLPGVVWSAMEAAAKGAALSDVHREVTNGRTVYAGSWQSADGPHELAVLEDGSPVSLELPTGRVPARVREMAGQREGGHEAGDEESAGATTGASKADSGQVSGAGVERMLMDAWEVEATVGGMTHQAVILPSGEILGSVAESTESTDEPEEQ